MDRDAAGDNKPRNSRRAERQQREARLADALRANLKRRKAQLRGRSDHSGEKDPDGENGPQRE